MRVVAIQLSVPGLYAPPVFVSLNVSSTPPDDHLGAGPYCGVSGPAGRDVQETRRRPTVRIRIVSAAGIQIDRLVSSTPDDHFAARPLYGVGPSGLGRIAGTDSRPAVSAGIVSAAAVQVAVITTSASGPDDHFTASPNRRRILSRKRRVDRAGRCPGIAACIVSAARTSNRSLLGCTHPR